MSDNEFNAVVLAHRLYEVASDIRKNTRGYGLRMNRESAIALATILEKASSLTFKITSPAPVPVTSLPTGPARRATSENA